MSLRLRQEIQEVPRDGGRLKKDLRPGILGQRYLIGEQRPVPLATMGMNAANVRYSLRRRLPASFKFASYESSGAIVHRSNWCERFRKFARAFDLVTSLPVGLSADELRAHGAEYIQAARTVAIRLEMVGALVYRRTISFDVTEEVCGGATVAAWHRVKALVEAQRAEQDYPMYLEWFQWLAEQFEGKYLAHTPAYLRERNWKPNG